MGALVAALSLLLAATVHGASVRVPPDYFGVNFQDPYSLPQAVRHNHLASMEAARLKQVRLPIEWSKIEPSPPDRDGHDYHWGKVDDAVAALARHGIRAQAMFAYAPSWASNATPAEQVQCRSSGAAGLAAGAPASYAAAAHAVARRYGAGGNFWQANPGLPSEPVRLYEIWNAPNTAGAWCPRVDPEGYGIMFWRAGERIREIDANAQVVVGGLGTVLRTQGGSVATAEFLQRMVQGKPAVKGLASAVAVHAYPGGNLLTQLNSFPTFRDWIRAAGFSDSVPMLVNEIGFSRAGAIDMTEGERVASYRNVTSKLPRTNCNISGMLPYAWATREQDLNDAEHWFGIASPRSGNLYPSGEEYVHWVDRFRGRLGAEAPTQTLELCAGMPLPDGDGDGVPDEDDFWPLDPARPNGGGSGGGPACTIKGTNGSDVLDGTAVADVICARRGADLVRGRGGRDVIRGGRGRDVLYGGPGRDVIRGGRGRDWLFGGAARDLLRGGPGRDHTKQ